MEARDRAWRERGLRDAVLAGDQLAWRTLYDEAFDSLYAYVLWRYAGARDWADEITQETWLTAVRRIRAFDPDRGSFLGWLRGIAANVIRNHLRKHRNVPEPLKGGVEAAAAEDPARSHAERSEQVARALGALPELYEAVLRAKY